MVHPNFLDRKEIFERQFSGITTFPFSYSDFEETRTLLVREIARGWTDNERDFLVSFKKGNPKWKLLPLEKLPQMPAVRWKLENIRKLIQQKPIKYSQQLRDLQDRLEVPDALIM